MGTCVPLPVTPPAHNGHLTGGGPSSPLVLTAAPPTRTPTSPFPKLLSQLGWAPKRNSGSPQRGSARTEPHHDSFGEHPGVPLPDHHPGVALANQGDLGGAARLGWHQRSLRAVKPRARHRDPLDHLRSGALLLRPLLSMAGRGSRPAPHPAQPHTQPSPTLLAQGAFQDRRPAAVPWEPAAQPSGPGLETFDTSFHSAPGFPEFIGPKQCGPCKAPSPRR